MRRAARATDPACPCRDTRNRQRPACRAHRIADRGVTTVAKPKITSAQLLGKGGSWVKSKLGEPTFVRAEKTANIWQYKNHVCVLNVFLYIEGEDLSQPHVLHFDARNAKGANTDRDRCLAMLQD